MVVVVVVVRRVAGRAAAERAAAERAAAETTMVEVVVMMRAVEDKEEVVAAGAAGTGALAAMAVEAVAAVVEAGAAVSPWVVLQLGVQVGAQVWVQMAVGPLQPQGRTPRFSSKQVCHSMRRLSTTVEQQHAWHARCRLAGTTMVNGVNK
jgi:hypothetical protein